MNPKAKKILRFTVRWGIAVAGIYWVLSNISLYDRVLTIGPDGWPVSLRVIGETQENDASYKVEEPDGEEKILPRSDLLVRPDRPRVIVKLPDGKTEKVDIHAVRVVPGEDRGKWPLLISPPRNLWQRYWDEHTAKPQFVEPSSVVGGYDVHVPYPVLEIGMLRMVRHAQTSLLLAALAIMPLTFLITSYRWHELLLALGIHIGQAKAFVLTMVGAFYNTFMPGSTGGDLLKAYYVSKYTEHRTRAVMSVLIDRIIGLLSLIILGGTIAAFQWENRDCRRVAIASWALIGLTALGLWIFFHPKLRKYSGLDFILKKLPMQKQILKAVETMEILGRRPLMITWMIVVTFLVHASVILAAMFAGQAFGLPIPPSYYWVVVPVIVLVGALPISPQGAGVMEFFAISLTRSHGATVSQAFALTMSIRLVQIFWNLVGGLFVFRGGYHAPTVKEQHELEEDSATEDTEVTEAKSVS